MLALVLHGLPGRTRTRSASPIARWPQQRSARPLAAFVLLGASLMAAVLVFILLAGILVGIVMNLAGQATPGPSALAFSRWLMAVLLAVPVVYGGAVTVSAWRAARRPVA